MKKYYFLFTLLSISTWAQAQVHSMIIKEKAKEYIEAYGAYVGQYAPNDLKCKIPAAWTIKDSTLESIKEDHDAIRAYIGKWPGENGELHLILVGVTDGVEDSTELVNLIHPCPNTCDYQSTLFKSYCDGFTKYWNLPADCNGCAQALGLSPEHKRK